MLLAIYAMLLTLSDAFFDAALIRHYAAAADFRLSSRLMPRRCARFDTPTRFSRLRCLHLHDYYYARIHGTGHSYVILMLRCHGCCARQIAFRLFFAMLLPCRHFISIMLPPFFAFSPPADAAALIYALYAVVDAHGDAAYFAARRHT